MTDGSAISLEPALVERVEAFATAAASNVDAVVREAVSVYLDNWSETVSRLADYDRDGIAVDAEDVLKRFRSAVASRVRGLNGARRRSN